jgi:hypothetical protein
MPAISRLRFFAIIRICRLVSNLPSWFGSSIPLCSMCRIKQIFPLSGVHLAEFEDPINERLRLLTSQENEKPGECLIHRDFLLEVEELGFAARYVT